MIINRCGSVNAYNTFVSFFVNANVNNTKECTFISPLSSSVPALKGVMQMTNIDSLNRTHSHRKITKFAHLNTQNMNRKQGKQIARYSHLCKDEQQCAKSKIPLVNQEPNFFLFRSP